MNKLHLSWFQCVVWCCPWSSFCWIQLNLQSHWVLPRVFTRTPILILQPYHIAHHHPVFVIWLLLVLFFLVVVLLLLLFLWCLSIFAVHIPYSSYTINKQFHVGSAVFLQVHLVLLSWVLIQRCIISQKWIHLLLKYFWKFSWKFYGQKKWHDVQVASKWSINLHQQLIIETIPWCVNLLV